MTRKQTNEEDLDQWLEELQDIPDPLEDDDLDEDDGTASIVSKVDAPDDDDTASCDMPVCPRGWSQFSGWKAVEGGVGGYTEHYTVSTQMPSNEVDTLYEYMVTHRQRVISLAVLHRIALCAFDHLVCDKEEDEEYPFELQELTPDDWNSWGILINGELVEQAIDAIPEREEDYAAPFDAKQAAHYLSEVEEPLDEQYITLYTLSNGEWQEVDNTYAMTVAPDEQVMIARLIYENHSRKISLAQLYHFAPKTFATLAAVDDEGDIDLAAYPRHMFVALTGAAVAAAFDQLFDPYKDERKFLHNCMP